MIKSNNLFPKAIQSHPSLQMDDKNIFYESRTEHLREICNNFYLAEIKL